MGFDPGAFSNSLMCGLSVGQGLMVNAENVQRQRRLDEERAEDRTFKRTLLQNQEDRSQELFDLQKKEYDRLAKKYKTEEEIKQGIRDTSYIQSSIDSFVKTGAWREDPEFYSAINRVFPDLINVGGPPGAQKEWVGGALVPPGKDGSPAGVIPHLKVTPSEGESYVAPMTGPNRDHTDKDVTVIPFRELFSTLGTRQQALQVLRNRLRSKQAYYDPEGYWKNKRTLAAEERKNKIAMEKENRDHDFDLKKLDREYSLKRGLEVAKAKNGGSGKSDLIQLKTGRTATLNDLRQSYIATYGKADSMGNFIGTADGAPNYEEWVNGQAVQPVFTVQESPAVDMDDPLYLEAQKRAERWVNDQAGYLSSDESDFAAYGGNRQQAIAEKTLEFYNMLKGSTVQKSKGRKVHPAVDGMQAGKGKQPKQQKPQKLDKTNPEHMKIAREILKEAKGDKAKARQIAKKRGYSF